MDNAHQTHLREVEIPVSRRLISAFQKWPAWLQAATVGALIIFLAGPIVGVIVNVYQGIVDRNSTRFVEAGALALVSVVAGGVGGILCCLTHKIRQRGYIGMCAGWTIIITVYLLAALLMMLAAHGVDPKLELPAGINDPLFLQLLLVFGVTFGIFGGTIQYYLERKSQRRQARLKEKQSLRELNPNSDVQ